MPDTKTSRSIELYATSTIAMSIINLLAVRKMSLRADLVFLELGQHHPGLERHLVDRALEELVTRRLVVQSNAGYRCADPNQRIVVSRDRSDFTVNHTTGEQEGGWNGWASPHGDAPVFHAVPVLSGGMR